MVTKRSTRRRSETIALHDVNQEIKGKKVDERSE